LLAEIDNGYWGGDQNIPKPRPSFQINNTHPGTDVAAGTAAAFAACSNLYAGRSFSGVFQSPASLKNSSYSQTLLTHAQQLYDFAKNATGGQTNYQKSVPAVAETYASSSFGDDLAIAALFLALGTNSTSLYQEAENHFKNYRLGGQDVVFNWDSKTPGLYILFAQIAQSDANLGGSLGTWQGEAERYLDRIVNGKGPAYLTSG
jgi:endoglucanase